MGFFKKALATAGITAALIGADYTCGGQTCAEAYDRQVHAPPNGSPVTAAVSRLADNFDHLSPYGQAAVLVPPIALVVGGVLYFGSKSDDKKKKKE